MACSFDIIWRFRPSPKARSSRIVTVPQASEAIVSVARFFWRRAEREEELQDEPDRRSSWLHRYSFIATTGSSREASRAGK